MSYTSMSRPLADSFIWYAVIWAYKRKGKEKHNHKGAELTAPLREGKKENAQAKQFERTKEKKKRDEKGYRRRKRVNTMTWIWEGE